MTRYHKILFVIFIVGFVIFLTVDFEPSENEIQELTLPELKPLGSPAILNSKSALGSEENPEARAEYFYSLTKDPKTGQIPVNIRQKELTFSKKAAVFAKSNKRNLNTTLQWESVGPQNFGGRTRALAIDATNDSRYLAGGVSGRIWVSDNRGATWVQTGPADNIQSVTAIAQNTNPGFENIWYYGTGELVFNTARIAAATNTVPLRGDGIFKSTDGGLSWSVLPSTIEGEVNRFNSQFQYIYNIVTDPGSDADHVYAAAYGGILRSTDGGQNWSVVLGDSLINLPDTVDLNSVPAPFYTDIQVSEEGTFYAALSNVTNRVTPDNAAIISLEGGIYKSEDGVNWEEITPFIFPDFYRRTVLGIDPSNSERLFVFTEAIDENGTRNELFRYDGDQGINGRWVRLSQNLPDFGEPVGNVDVQSGYNMVIRVHPDNPNVVFLGATNLFRSTDGFTSTDNISWIGGYSPENDISIYPNSHPDHHSIVFHNNSNEMSVGHDSGISFTENNLSDSVTWQYLSEGYVTTQYYTVAIDEFGDSEVILGGLQDNGVLLRGFNTNPIWQRILQGDGAYAEITRDRLYYFASTQMGRIFQLTFNDDFELNSFGRVDPLNGGQGAGYLFINPFITDPFNQNVLFVAGGSALWRNSNVSQLPRFTNDPTPINYSLISGTGFTDNEQVSALGISQDIRGKLYVGTTIGNLRRIDQAHTDNPVVEVIGGDPVFDNAFIICIAVDRLNSNNILVVLGNYNIPSLHYSEDGGTTFTNVSGNLEEFPDGSGGGPSTRWAEIVPLANGQNHYFVGTTMGLWSTTELNGIETVWQKEGEDNIGNSVVGMIKSRPEDGRIVIATHGNGIFQANLSNTASTAIDTSVDTEVLQVSNPFPNPLIDQTTLQYVLPQDGPVRIRVFDVNGAFVRNLIWASQFAGINEVSWDGTKEGGDRVGPGIYIYRVEYASDVVTGRIAVLSQ